MTLLESERHETANTVVTDLQSCLRVELKGQRFFDEPASESHAFFVRIFVYDDAAFLPV
jgi:hypothetical protein